ncbi:MAG: DUF6580 family putative transport protein [Bryobacteraceae bacterium]
MENTKRPLAVGLTVLGAVARLLPHPPNFAPVGSVSLFGGARLRGWQAYALPLALMAVTDPLVGGYNAATPFVYASFLITVWLGRMLRASESPWRIGTVCAVSSVQFFLLTNFGMWLMTAMYPHTAAGLALCYVNALPFFGRTLAADLLYSGALFGMHAWLSRALYRPERVAA